MTISINQISSGTGLRINGAIFLVTDYNHVKPGKGSAFVRVKLKNVKTQQVLERTFKTADKLDDVLLEEYPYVPSQNTMISIAEADIQLSKKL